MRKTLILTLTLALVLAMVFWGCTMGEAPSTTPSYSSSSYSSSSGYTQEREAPSVVWLKKGKLKAINSTSVVKYETSSDTLIGMVLISDSSFSVDPIEGKCLEGSSDFNLCLSKGEIKVKIYPGDSVVSVAVGEDDNPLTISCESHTYREYISSSTLMVMVMAPSFKIRVYSPSGKLLESDDVWVVFTPSASGKYKYVLTPKDSCDGKSVLSTIKF